MPICTHILKSANLCLFFYDSKILKLIGRIFLTKNSIENIAYHIRNSICHYRFDIINCNVENIENVHIRDKSGDDANAPITFDLELSFDEFRKFILKYAEMLELKLKNI